MIYGSAAIGLIGMALLALAPATVSPWRRAHPDRRRSRDLPGGRLGADDRHHPEGRSRSLHGHQQCRRPAPPARSRRPSRLVLMDAGNRVFGLGPGRVGVRRRLLVLRHRRAAAHPRRRAPPRDVPTPVDIPAEPAPPPPADRGPRPPPAYGSTPDVRPDPGHRPRPDAPARRGSPARSPVGASGSGPWPPTARGPWPTAARGSRAGSAAPRTRTAPGAGRSSAAASRGSASADASSQTMPQAPGSRARMNQNGAGTHFIHVARPHSNPATPGRVKWAPRA